MRFCDENLRIFLSCDPYCLIAIEHMGLSLTKNIDFSIYCYIDDNFVRDTL